MQVIALLNAYYLPSPSLAPTFDYVLFTPYYPTPLSALLNSHSFVPAKLPTTSNPSSDFFVLAHTLIWQMMDAVRYLHGNGIAHRDLSVGNFVLSAEGRIVLIDFGISIVLGDELPGEMHCEIGTGSVLSFRSRNQSDQMSFNRPYRAPELLFSSRDYDPLRLDLWSIGAVVAEFFTPFTIRPTRDSPSSSLPDSEIRATSSYGDLSGAVDMEEHGDGDLGEMEEKLANVFLAPNGDASSSDDESTKKRSSLFYSGFGELSLIGSIFRIIGTPNYQTWPEASSLSDFSRLAFAPFLPTPLLDHLPHLRADSPISFILPRLLVCRAAERISMEDAMVGIDMGWETVEYFRLDWDDDAAGVAEKQRLRILLASFL